jgi:LysM repeat protein
MNKSTKLLIATLLVLVAVVYFFLPSEKEQEVSYKIPVVSVAIDSASIVKIEVKQTARSVVIENIGGVWTVTTPLRAAADPIAVAQLLNGLSKFKVGSHISSNPDRQRLFQVDSAGTFLSLTDRSGKVVSMIVGKMGPSFSEIYFRLPDSKDVYLGNGIDSWAINKNLKDWRNRYIIRTPSEEMNEISIATGSRTFIFRHEGGAWKLGDKIVETTEMNPLLNALSDMRADDFIDSTADLKFKPIAINIKAGNHISLNLYPTSADSAHYIVQSSTSKQLYLINKWTVQQILKPTGKPTPVAPQVKQIAETPKPAHIITTKKESVAKQDIPIVTPKKEIGKRPTSEVISSTKEGEQKPASEIISPKTDVINKQPAKKNPLIDKSQSLEPPAPPADETPKSLEHSEQTGDDEGTLIVHTVKKGETMTTIAKKYNVRAEQILKWNLLKSIAVKPGQELYIYTKK